MAFFHEALGARASKFDRVGALVRFVSANAPNWLARLQGALERVDELPIRTDSVTPLGFGSGSTCVTLDGSPQWVLKVFRRSLGRDVLDLVQTARKLQDDYRTLKRWYVEVPDLLPPTLHVVLRSPLLGLPAAARIQCVVPEPTRDLVRDLTDHELISLMHLHQGLGRSFRAFVEATRRAWDEEDRVLDLVGPGNVILLDREPEPALRVADFGIMDLERKRRRTPHVYAAAATTLERLERLAGRIDH